MSEADRHEPLRGWNVLVVEDEFYIADDIARALGQLGGQVVGPVPSRDMALDLLAGGRRVDLAVLDINLEGEEVYPVAERLEGMGIRFLFATGYDAVSLPERFRDLPLWEKPFDPYDLVRALPQIGRNAQESRPEAAQPERDPTMIPPSALFNGE